MELQPPTFDLSLSLPGIYFVGIFGSFSKGVSAGHPHGATGFVSQRAPLVSGWDECPPPVLPLRVLVFWICQGGKGGFNNAPADPASFDAPSQGNFRQGDWTCAIYTNL